MSLIAKDKGGTDRKPLDPDIYLAVCDMVVDLGVQDGGQYADKQQCFIRFQIPSERVTWKEDETEMEGPVVIGMFQTVSLHKKSKLRPILESWRGRQFTADEAKAFDLFSLLGKPCRLNVVHKTKSDGTIRANIDTVMSLGKGNEAPICELDPIGYSRGSSCVVAGTERPEGEVYDLLPEWLQKKVDAQIITGSAPAAQAATAQPTAEPVAAGAAVDDDEPPF